MVKTSQGAFSRWLGRRPFVLRECARFAGWCVQQAITPRRRVIAGLGITVFLLTGGLIAVFSQLWLAGLFVAFAVAVVGGILLASYAAARIREMAERIVANSVAAADTVSGREERARASLETKLAMLEANLTQTSLRYDTHIAPFVEVAGETFERQQRALGSLEVRLEGYVDEIKSAAARTHEELNNVVRGTHDLRVTLEAHEVRHDSIASDLETRTNALRQRIDRSLLNISRSLSEAHAKTLLISDGQDHLRSQTVMLQEASGILAARVESLAASAEEGKGYLQEAVTSVSADVAGVQRQIDGLASSTAVEVQAVRHALTLAVERLTATLTASEDAIAARMDLIASQTAAVTASSAKRERDIEDQLRDMRAVDELLKGAVGRLLADLDDTHVALAQLKDSHRSQEEKIEENLARLQARDDTLEAALSDETLNRAVHVDNRLSAYDAMIEQISASVSDVEAGVRDKIGELKALLETRMGPEFEQRLEAWRDRLDNEIGAAVQTGRMEDQVANLERETRLRDELSKLHQLIQRHREVGQQADAEALEALHTLRMEVENVRQANDELARADPSALSKLEAEIVARIDQEKWDAAAQLQATADDVSRRLEDTARQLSLLQDGASRDGFDVRPITEGLNQALATAEEARQLAERAAERANDGVLDRLVALEEDRRGSGEGAISQDAYKRLSDANAPLARPFERLLSPEKLQRFESYWLKAFGLNINRTALAYLAHKICQLEDQGDGRIAAPIETIILRQLALRSVSSKAPLQVMEIGTLFGLGAAVLYNMRDTRSSHIELTLIDPLQGYYDHGRADPVTGIDVTEQTVVNNLVKLGVPRDHFRLIRDKSGSPAALAGAADRTYDYILVDGDHSTAGVAADFANYGPMVRPGGLLLFDDYGSPDWPGIQPFVDEVVRTDPEWVWIGGEFKTAILSKKAGRRPARRIRSTDSG